jgi:hypothetical protein
MTRYSLTADQQQLLSTLVRLTNEGKLRDPIVPIPVGHGKSGVLEYVLHLRGENSFSFKNVSDMDRFCELGLMTFRWNRQGIGKLFTLTGKAITAVENQFEQPFTPPGPRHRPDLIVQAMNGHLTAEQVRQITPNIDQIVADPILLHTTVEALAYSLLEIIHQELKGPPLHAYTRTLNDFKDALYNGRLAPKERQTYARQLILLDEESPFNINLWPYLYPLFLIAERRQRIG